MSTDLRLFELSELQGTVHFGVIAIREDEFEAVITRLGERIGEARGRRVYNVYEVKTAKGAVARVVACRSIAQGNGPAQEVATDIAEEVRPAWMFVCGIGGAVPSDEYSLGDVVLASRIDDLRVGAVLADGTRETAPAGGPLHRDARALVENVVAIKRELGPWNSTAAIGFERPALTLEPNLFPGDDDWNKKTRRGLEAFVAAARPPLVTARVVAATDLNMKHPEFVKAILGPFRDVGLFEMESAGIHQIAHNRDIPFISVRGVSDVVGFDKAKPWVSYACHTAAALLKALITYDPLPKLPENGSGSTVVAGGGSGGGTVAESLLLRSVNQFAESRSGTGVSGTIEMDGRVISIDTTPPPIEDGTSERKQTVGDIAKDVRVGTWTHLHGLSGFGKTALALARRIVEARLEFDVLWLRLRDLDERESAAVLDALCGGSRRGYDRFKSAIHRPLLLTVDDVPLVSREGALSERLQWLLADTSNIAFLSTSVHRLPEWLVRRYDRGRTRQLTVPAMLYEEFVEALRVRGAPENLLKQDSVLRLLYGLVEGVPILVAALAAFLEGQSWAVDESSVHAIFRGAYKEDVEREVLGHLAHGLRDRDATRLLYRLSLDRGPWAMRQIMSLAAVLPRIDRVKERIGMLDGLWMQRDGPDKRLPSPLVLDLGETELLEEEAVACHKVIGRDLLYGRVDQITLLRSIRHSIKGDDHPQATIALLSGLHAFVSLSEKVPDFGLLDISIEHVARDAPGAMKSVIYALQAAGRSKAGREVSEVTEAVERFEYSAVGLTTVGPDEASALLTATFVLSIGADLHFKERAHALLPRVAEWLMVGKSSLENEFDRIITWFGSEIWLAGVQDPTIRGLSRWVALIDRIPSSIVQQIARQELAAYASPIIGEIPVSVISEPAHASEWRDQIIKLEALIDWARQRDLPWLAAWFVRSVQMIFVEKLKALDEALDWTQKRSDLNHDDSLARFVTSEILGIALAVAGRFEAAENWLGIALSGGTTPFRNRHVVALVWSAVVNHRLGRSREHARHLIAQAIELADAGEGVEVLDPVKTRAEYAQLLFLQGDIAGALRAFDDSYRLLLQQEATNEWKDTFVLFQVVVLNLTAKALGRESKRPIPVEVHELQPGMFFTINKKRREGFKSDNVMNIGFLAADAAFVIGEDEISRRSLSRLLVTAEATNDNPAAGHARVRLALHDLIGSFFAEAIRVACEGISRMRRDRTNGTEYRSSPDGREVRMLTIAILVPMLLQCAAVFAQSISEGERRLHAIKAGLAEALDMVNPAWRPALREVGELLDIVENGSRASSDLFARAVADAARGGSLWAVAAIARTFWINDIRLKDVAAAHIQVFQETIEAMAALPGIISRMVAPSVVLYWQYQLANRRIEFSHPTILDGGIQLDEERPAAGELERILRALMFALNISSPPAGRWPTWG